MFNKVYDFVEMTSTWLRVKSVRKTILDHERYFNASETSMAKSILNWVPYEDKMANTLLYFEFLRSRDLKSHKVHARFALTIFEMVGAVYIEL